MAESLIGNDQHYTRLSSGCVVGLYCNNHHSYHQQPNHLFCGKLQDFGHHQQQLMQTSDHNAYSLGNTMTEAPAISSMQDAIVVHRNATSLTCGKPVITSNSNIDACDTFLVCQNQRHSKHRHRSYMSITGANPNYCKKRRKEQRARMWPPPTRSRLVRMSIRSNPITTSPMILMLLVSLMCTFSFAPVISALRFTRTEPSNRARSPSSQYYPMYYPNDLPIVSGPSGWDGQNNNIPFEVSSSSSSSKAIPLGSSFSGGEIHGHQVLIKQVTSSPLDATNRPDYKIFSDIIVPSNSRLDIEPGVVLAFAPKTGLIVRGTLIANVS